MKEFSAEPLFTTRVDFDSRVGIREFKVISEQLCGDTSLPYAVVAYGKPDDGTLAGFEAALKPSNLNDLP